MVYQVVNWNSLRLLNKANIQGRKDLTVEIGKKRATNTHDAVDMRKLKSFAFTFSYLSSCFAATFIFMPCSILIVIASYLETPTMSKNVLFPFSMCKRFAVVNIISSLSRCSALPSLSIVYCFCLHRNSFMYIELIIGFFLCLNDEITHTFIEYIRTHRILWASDQHTDWERYKYNVFSDTIESRNFIAAYNSFHFLLSAVYFTFSLYCCHQRATKYATHTHRTRAKAECLLVSASPVRGLSQCECLFN